MSEFAKLVCDDGIEIIRILPASIERVWAFLVDPELRQKWFCGGIMGEKAGEPFVMEFDNSRLSVSLPPEAKADACNASERMQGTLTHFEPPHKLAYSWPGETKADDSHVSIELEDLGGETRLRLRHTRVADLRNRTEAAAGWHAHFDVLCSVISGNTALDFWGSHNAARAEYKRLFDSDA
ncbi:MAG: SRPBCC family protein [Aureliella sp.]